MEHRCSWTPLAPLKEGDLIGNGKYEIISDTENAGGFGRIYRARTLKSTMKWHIGRTVAIKEFHVREFAQEDPTTLFDSEFTRAAGHESIDILLEQFRYEAEILYKLSEQRDCHVPQLYHRVKQDQGRWFYAMNYIDGPTLKEVVKHGAMNEATAIGYVAQIAKVLHKAHKWQLFHNDISPNNIMLDNGIAVLVDFGNARGYANILQQKGGSPEMIEAAERISDRFSDLRAGTGGYAAPDELHLTPQGRDVYSLAATLYFLLTGGVPPLTRKREKMKARLAEKGISEQATQAILNAMAPGEKGGGTQSARDFLGELPRDFVFDTLLNYNDYDYNRRP